MNVKFELENIFKKGIENEWDEYVNEIANEYCICVDNRTTEFELWCYDCDLEELFTDYGIRVGKVINFEKEFNFDEDTYEPVGLDYNDYIETVELKQYGKTYLCRAYCAHNGVGADYAFALFDIEKGE